MTARDMAHRDIPRRPEWPLERRSRIHPVIAAAAQVAALAVALVFVWVAIAWGGVVIGTALGIDMRGGLPL